MNQKFPDHKKHQQTCRNGEVRLIDAAGENDEQHSGKPVRPTASDSLFYSQDTQQKGKRIAAAGIHITKGADLRGKTDNQARQKNLSETAADLKQPYNYTDRDREKEYTYDPVQPWHGVVGDHIIMRDESAVIRLWRGVESTLRIFDLLIGDFLIKTIFIIRC